PIKIGIARGVDQICTCGLRCGVCSGVSDPEHIRTIDDTLAFLSEPHSREQHRRDLNFTDYSFVDPVRTLTKIHILEIIEPGDPPLRTPLRGARGIARGNVIFVHASGLKNPVFWAARGARRSSGTADAAAASLARRRVGSRNPSGRGSDS